ncbi:hypothetical protein [Polaribacter aestuariivivens]|uniref:hypothetical protein n=1 Tax=Polaribacter aestuariivivens TaxID=2304626 RepID=UPI003F496FC8
MIKIVEIFVTPSDIKEGTQKSASSCAISFALKRAYPVASWVLVFGSRKNQLLVDDKDINVFPVDKYKVQTFINDFDTNKGSVQPFSFRVMQKQKDE